MNYEHNLDKLCDIYGCHNYSKFNPMTNYVSGKIIQVAKKDVKTVFAEWFRSPVEEHE